MTAPAKIHLSWADQGLPRPEANYEYRSPGQPIPYEKLDLAQPWERFNTGHELTTKGLQKFAEDYPQNPGRIGGLNTQKERGYAFR